MSFLLAILTVALADTLGSGSASEALFSRRAPETSVEAGWRGRSEASPLIPEEGQAAGEGVVDIRTLVRPSTTSAVSGKVQYANGFRNGVLWNSSSDYAVVYPYVMADSLSGNVRKETYAFSGGYAFKKGEWNFGIGGSYRALHEWREVDPRPRNIVSDLKVTISSGRQVSPAYVLDVSAFYRKYSQSNSVSYFNPRGANSAQFHLTGLGSYFYRFSGTISSYLSTRYNGNGGGVALTLFPFRDRGWKAALEYSFLDNVHHLPSLNEAPYTELVTHDLQLGADYSGGIWSAGARASAEVRSGYEQVLDNGIAGAYNSLMMFHMYSGVFYEASAHGKMQAGRWVFSAETAFRGFLQQYMYPGRSFSASGLRLNAGATYSRSAGAWMLRADAAAIGYIPLDARMIIPAKYTLEALQDFERTKLMRVSAASIGLHASVEAERPISKNIRGIARAGAYYDSLDSVFYSMTIGIKL